MTYTEPLTQQPHRRTRAWIIAAIITLALIGAGLGVWLTAGSSGSTPTSPVGGNLTACRIAMQRDFNRAMANPGGPTATRPAACVGVSDADVIRIADDIMASAFSGAPAPSMVLAASTRSTTAHLMHRYACHPMSAPIRPPVTGYLIGLHSNPSAPLFFRSVDDLTAGLFYGMGGDWVARYWCTKPTAATAATPTRRIMWGVTGYRSGVGSVVVYPRRLFATRAAADAYLVYIQRIETRGCRVLPALCATFVEAPVIVL